MKILVVVSLFAVALGASISRKVKPVFPEGKIVGGTPASIEEIPWQVQMENRGSLMCGGSIYSETVVVTAAHCCDGSSASNIKFRAGSDKQGSGGTLHQASKLKKHPNYNSSTVDNDVCLGLLDKGQPFVFSDSVKAIPLTSNEPGDGTNVLVSGFGTTSSGGPLPGKLLKVTVITVNRGECNGDYGSGSITDRMLCAGVPEGGKDSCQGDSGGPLVVNNTLAGIVSWGRGCAAKGYPGVYSNVYNLRPWILQNAQ